MKRITTFACMASLMLTLSACSPQEAQEAAVVAEPTSEWIDLFDGRTFDGWKASETKDCFTIQDGAFVANGKRSHLFYQGPVMDHNFTNFELTVDVMTRKNSNGGVYFHTEYQETGWPSKGYEVQVNNTHKDWKKTGSLYNVVNVEKSPAKDDVWFTEHIIVNGKQVTIKVDGVTVVEYTEPENPEHAKKQKGRLLSSGTFALQGHDPGSTVYFKNIRVKPLP